MARKRILSPDFFLHEDLAKTQPLARLLFAGLWTLADREGRLEDRPARIRVQVLPWDDCDVNELLDELQRVGSIVRYVVDGRKLISVPSFLTYQCPHRNEVPSTIPPPYKRKKTHQGSPEALPRLADPVPVPVPVPVLEDSRQLALTPAPAPGDSLPKVKPKDQSTQAIFAYWAEKLGHPRAILDAKRQKLLKARVDEGMTLEEGRAVVDGCLVDMQSWPDRRKFDGIDYLFENRASVEKFADLSRKGNPKPVRDVTRGHQSEGDWDDYFASGGKDGAL